MPHARGRARHFSGDNGSGAITVGSRRSSPAIYRDFLPADLLPIARAPGHRRGRSSYRQHRRGTKRAPVLRSCGGDADRRGAWWDGYPFGDRWEHPVRIASLAEHPWLVGLRPMVQDDPTITGSLMHGSRGAMTAHGSSSSTRWCPRGHLSRLARVLRWASDPRPWSWTMAPSRPSGKARSTRGAAEHGDRRRAS